MLILFDIDMTLLKTSGAGRRAMQRAGSAMYDKPFTIEGLDFSGRLDPLILAELLALNGIDPTPQSVSDMKRAYIEAFTADAENTIDALPGATALVRTVAAEPGVTPGVLTGNFAETGTHKLRAAGFDPAEFRVCVWGDESPHDPPRRDHLPSIAFDRYRALHGGDPSETVILGDTPHDVQCALANGCRVLGVATGRSDAEELEQAGAHRVVESLAATRDVAAWILGG